MGFWKYEEDWEQEERMEAFLEVERKKKDAEQMAVIEGLIELFNRTSQHFVLMVRSEYASSGRAFTTRGNDLFFGDVWNIGCFLARANGQFTVELSNILLGVGSPLLLGVVSAGPRAAKGWSSRDPINAGMAEAKNALSGMSKWRASRALGKVFHDVLQADDVGDIQVPFTVKTLAVFDHKNDTRYAADAAGAFLKYISYVCAHGVNEFSEANAYVRERYAALLSPYAEPSTVEVGTLT
jgi:hypothetical protein